MTKRSSRSDAARRGWETRRENERIAARDARRAERHERIESLRRSERARKGWKTRREAERQKQRAIEQRSREGKRKAAERSERSRKGWETRRRDFRAEEVFESIDDGDGWEIEVGIDYAP